MIVKGENEKTEVLGENLVSVSLCPLEIPRELPWHWWRGARDEEREQDD